MVGGSAGGRDKDRVPPDLARPDPLEATAPAIDVSGMIDLPRLREDVRGLFAGSARPETVQGFVFAVSEATTNAVMHGWPPVRVRVWSASRPVSASRPAPARQPARRPVGPRQPASRPVPAGTAVPVSGALIGDPRRGHPVAAFGRGAAKLETRMYADERFRGALYTSACVLAAALPAVAAHRLTRHRPLLRGPRSRPSSGRSPAPVRSPRKPNGPQ